MQELEDRRRFASEAECMQVEQSNRSTVDV